MKTIKRLCDRARRLAAADPDGPEETLQVKRFNAKLDEYKKRFLDAHLIGLVEPRTKLRSIIGHCSNGHIGRGVNLAATSMTQRHPNSNAKRLDPA